ncbi:MAG: hypothetical protein WBC40_11705 [Halobacteriota archaeon]
MTNEEKYRYIFENTSFEGRPRVKWITDCLLGDIRTFLDSIENYTDNKEKFAFKPLPRGGGNLSTPILISTALEFVSRLYIGETKFRSSEGYNAKENTKKFIEKFFPEKYKEIPQLLWDGIRNGLVHTFSPKPFKYQNNSIRFQFYVEDRNIPSHIKKAKDTIVISINVFELYKILENAIKDYLDELKNNEDDLQDNFIKAWSSIEEDFRREITENSEYRNDAKALLAYLGSSSGALLLEDLNKVINIDVLRIYTPKIRRS